MSPEHRKAAGWAFVAQGALAALILLGSRHLQHFDAALIGYTFATLFATFGVTFRYVMWLQRPPTARLWSRGWRVFFRRGFLLSNVGVWCRRVLGEFAANEFILRRSPGRWLNHMLIMWGCVLGCAVTFPLVFGWIHFETAPDSLSDYQAVAFGFPVARFPVESLTGFLIFHALVWSALLVIAGVMLAMRRRLLDHGAAALQQFSEDFLPLFLLFAISVTGLMLTASYTWMKGYAYDFIASLHAVTVIFTLLWLPFGKFFHIFQRPAQLGVSFYQQVGQQEEQAPCLRCGLPFASRMQIQDLEEVEDQLGFDYRLGKGGHYQEVCPPCRRTLVGLAQGELWKGAR